MSCKRSSIFGVGVNDAEYPVYITSNKTVNGKNKVIQKWECPIYSTWRNMLMRCYSEKYQAKNKSYEGVSVCVEWHSFNNFCKWMKAQNFAGMHLDKDLLSGLSYSPETCLFIPPHVNYFIRDTKSNKGPSGACFDRSRGKWISSCATIEGKVKYLGRFDTELEAHLAWKAEKNKQARLLAETLTDERIKRALISRYC